MAICWWFLTSDSITDDAFLCLNFLQLSLMVHPDKCKHPQAKEAFGGA